MSIITLTTDFGLRDNFAGVMKGVILSINPAVSIVDLGHDLPAHEPAAAAFSVFTASPHFPEGTIHVVVVDPGVGSERDILAVRAFGQVFIAPDNGALSYVVEEDGSAEIRVIENRDLMASEISNTFHGRDVMAPVAAHLASGVPFEEVGPITDDIIRLPSLKARIDPDKINGQVIYIDRFGNLITNIPADAATSMAERGLTVEVAHVYIIGLSKSYSEVKRGQWLAVAGSSGFVEIARYMERAEHPPTLTLGTQVIMAAKS